MRPKEEILQDELLNNEEETKTKTRKLNYWLLQNLKIMEELSVKEPVSWREQDCGS